VLETVLADTARAFEIGSDGHYTRVIPPEGTGPVDAQKTLLAGIPTDS
jgi:hypothetical protein